MNTNSTWTTKWSRRSSNLYMRVFCVVKSIRTSWSQKFRNLNIWRLIRTYKTKVKPKWTKLTIGRCMKCERRDGSKVKPMTGNNHLHMPSRKICWAKLRFKRKSNSRRWRKLCSRTCLMRKINVRPSARCHLTPSTMRDATLSRQSQRMSTF